MARRLYFFIIVLITFSGCRQTHTNTFLVEIDSLLNYKDAAVAKELLEKVNKDNYTKEDSAYYDLLYTIANDLLYLPLPSDTVLTNCIDVFSELGDKGNTARACLYRGCVYTDGGEYVKAVEDIKHAEKLAREIGDSHLMLRAFLNLAFINHSSANYLLAKDYTMKALEISKDIKDKRWMGYCYQLLAGICARGKYDGGKDYIRESLKYVRYQPEKERGVYLKNIAQYVDPDNKEEREELLAQALSLDKSPDSYGNLAPLYSETGRDEVAEEYWNMSLGTTSKYLKIEYLKDYSNWLESKGRFQEAMQYANMALAVKDSLIKEQQTEQTKEIQERLDRENERVAYDKKLKKTRAIAISSFFFCVLFFMLYIQMRRRSMGIERKLQRNEKKRRQQKEIIDKLTSEGKAQTAQAKELQRELDVLNADYNLALNKGKEYYQTVVNRGSTATWKKADFVYFNEFYKKNNPEFCEYVNEHYRSLTASQRFLLCLQDMGLTDDEVCSVMNFSAGALRTTRSRIKKQMI